MATLNSMQQQAVDAGEGHYLILAGAGSGKTTVLTERAIRLLKDGEARPPEILSITFTNKAAKEMKDRIIAKAEGINTRDMWTCTFHSMGVRILRMFPDVTGFTASFTIYDADDTKKLVSDILKEEELDKRFKPAPIKSAISRYKNSRHVGAAQTPTSLAQFYDQDDRLSFGEWYEKSNPEMKAAAMDKVYEKYMDRLRKENAMDFDDLLINAYRVLIEDSRAREYFQERFKYIMVDEYQDTNPIQYRIVRILAAKHGNLFCVGDDDQSIYSFRGTDISIIRRFTEDFPDAKIIRLEENYRSNSGILDLANSIIANNTGRLGKTLWTQNKMDILPAIYELDTETDEAAAICQDIAHRHNVEGEPYGANAILYRMHSISRPIEEMLVRHGIPYRIYGGIGFYARKEIKDMLAYLSILINPDADQQLLRIINEPRRGIGAATIDKLKRAANQANTSILSVIRNPGPEFTAAVTRKLTAFANMIDELQAFSADHSIQDLIGEVYARTGYKDMLEADKKENEERIDNIGQLINSAREFDEEEQGGLAEYMQQLSLLTDQDQTDDNQDAVTLMTVHAAKGLEFDNVYIAGLVDDIFPSGRAVSEGNLEEERRLCYVAVTRARKRLTLLTTETRYMFGQEADYYPSPFLEEIPEEQVQYYQTRRKPPASTHHH